MTTVASPAESVTDVIERAVATGRSTPAQYRVASIACVVVLALAALVGSHGTFVADDVLDTDPRFPSESRSHQVGIDVQWNGRFERLAGQLLSPLHVRDRRQWAPILVRERRWSGCP